MKPERTPKKPVGKDWHSADIKAALEKAGWSLRRLSLHVGYRNPCTLGKVLREPWPKGQRLVAKAIGVDPADIWPSRYHDPLYNTSHNPLYNEDTTAPAGKRSTSTRRKVA